MATLFARTFYDTAPDGSTLVYDVERLWQLAATLPIEQVPLSEVEGELDYPYQWFKSTKPSPREVARHARRIYEADLSYPILLSSGGLVMDGIHRIAKCWLLGHDEIAAVRFPASLEPDRILPPTTAQEPFDP